MAGIGRARAGLLGATALGVCLVMGALQPHLSQAQGLPRELLDQIPDDANMLLEADSLVYDRDQNRVSAVGGVRIDYGGHRLVADRVTYDRGTRRLIASGNVEIVERSGAIVRAAEIDITDDFGAGFVRALEVETVDRTWFTAESAERESGNITTFTNGTYTACEACADDPDKPRPWRIRARKIIWNGEERTIRFEQAQFEMFGLPLFTMPYFIIPDHTVKRKSGFLLPRVRHTRKLGGALTVPYYLALSPSYDLTVQGTAYTRQGLLGEAEWRQKFDNGEYSVKFAGIYQSSPDAFEPGTVDAMKRSRLMVGTRGEFRLNPRWVFGWNVLAQTDKNFSRTYGIEGFDSYVHRSEVYLTGLNDRNYFDMRFMRFNVQEEIPDTNPASVDDTQPWVLPSLDYSRIHSGPVLGGELRFDVNLRAIHRESDHLTALAVPGQGGTSARLTAEAEWKRVFTTRHGLVITPSLHVRGDAIHNDPDPASIAHINAIAGFFGMPSDIRTEFPRAMATAGLEVRYPWLITAGNSTHVIEPVAQIFVRPDEPFAGRFGVPNEDAQSFVFDASNLFERDKWSGYDRIEGGTRANLGIRYSGTFASGWTADALVGQSYHIAGLNSFATPDLVHAGAESGLETDVSDFVAMVGVSSPDGAISASVGGRFDEETLEVRRAEIRTAYSGETVDAAVRFTNIEAQPLYGMPFDRRELAVSGTMRLTDNWKVFGGGTYDFASEKLVRSSIGFGYEDDCFSYILAYSEERSILGTEPTERSVGFRISLRTLGDIGSDPAKRQF